MMKIPNIFANIDMSEEAVNKRLLVAHKESIENLENMSYWLPKIESSTTRDSSILQIPKTKIIPWSFKQWKWLRSDSYRPEKIAEFGDYLVEKLKDFLPGETLFMKTGVFSNKFEFGSTIIEDRRLISKQLLNMFYTSMAYGADRTSEVVFREMIVDKEDRLKIYEGMPLHTEFRVFYDFDTQELIGISNYWHPELMEGNLRNPEDALQYEQAKGKLVDEYDKYKQTIAKEVAVFAEGVSGISGKWSIDVMKNDTDFWLIDMARMEKSALVQQMELV